MEKYEMTEIEKMKTAFDVFGSWRNLPPTETNDFVDWIQGEIERLEDPHAKAKKLIGHLEAREIEILWQLTESNAAKIVAYVRHLESELAKAKEAAAEPLDPKRAMATAAKVYGTKHEAITAAMLLSQTGDAKPYRVQE